MIRELVQAGFRLSGYRDPQLIRGLGWAIAEGFFTALPYILLYWLLSGLAEGNLQTATLLQITGLMVVALILRIAAGMISMPRIFGGAYAMMGEARLRLADHLRHLPLGWFARQRGGDLSSRLTSDLELVENLWSHFLGVFVSGLAMPAFLLLFLFYVDPRLAVVTLISIPFALLALYWSQRALAKTGPRMIQANANVHAALQEYIQGIAVVRGFGRFGQAWKALERALQEQHNATLKIESKPSPWLAAYGFTLELGYLLIIVAASWWLMDGSLSATHLTIFLVLALPVYRQLFEVGLSTMLLRFSRRAMQRIEALLAEPQICETANPCASDGQQIEFDKVSFSYGDKTVLNNLSVSIPAHGITAIVGPSGAGKTTLVQLIARLWDVNSGSIKIGGVDIRNISSDALHRDISMVFQDVVLFAGTVLSNIRLGRPDASEEEVIAAARLAQAHDFIAALPDGYHTVLDENGSSLSGGERQRISIARALLKDAPILLLDEATASIDPSAEAEIQQAIGVLAQGRTVIVIAHRLRTICDADQILVLKEGQLQEQGKHDALLQRNGEYARLWQRQQQAVDWQIGG